MPHLWFNCINNGALWDISYYIDWFISCIDKVDILLMHTEQSRPMKKLSVSLKMMKKNWTDKSSLRRSTTFVLRNLMPKQLVLHVVEFLIILSSAWCVFSPSYCCTLSDQLLAWFVVCPSVWCVLCTQRWRFLYIVEICAILFHGRDLYLLLHTILL